MSDMKCSIKCPMCGEVLQTYGEIDPDAGTSIVLGANCPKCGIRDSDIKLWQELIRTRKALKIALDAIDKGEAAFIGCQEADNKYISDVTAEDGLELMSKAYKQITALEQKDVK